MGMVQKCRYHGMLKSTTMRLLELVDCFCEQERPILPHDLSILELLHRLIELAQANDGRLETEFA